MTAGYQVPASWVRDHLRDPNAVLLVCAYEDEAYCREIALPHSITLQDLRRRLASLPRTQSIVFYCT